MTDGDLYYWSIVTVDGKWYIEIQHMFYEFEVLEYMYECQPGAFEQDKWLLAMNTSYIGLLLFYRNIGDSERKYCGGV